MRWVNSGCFMDFLVLFLVIWWVLCLFRCLKHSALGKMPCATICCTCKKQLTARTNSPILDTGRKPEKIRQLLVRFYEEITQKGGPHHPSPNRNHEATLGGYHRYPKEHLGTTMSPRKVISGIFRQIMDIQTCINMSQVIWNHFQNPSLHLT